MKRTISTTETIRVIRKNRIVHGIVRTVHKILTVRTVILIALILALNILVTLCVKWRAIEDAYHLGKYVGRYWVPRDLEYIKIIEE